MDPHSARVAGSFRDPSGFLFTREGVIYRQINLPAAADYDRLMDSGLYAELAQAGLLVPHREVDPSLSPASGAYRVIRPEQIPFISYPHEWCFSQLKDAALATLRVQQYALERGMALKDASAYNIQFLGGRPVLIDTLSLEVFAEGKPWPAYRQFCQHFLAPLALMAFRDIRLNQLFRVYIDGVPLDLASRLLPAATRLRFGLLTHLHLHAKSQKAFSGRRFDTGSAKVSRLGYLGLMSSLEAAVKGLTWKPKGTEWGEYYGDTNYSGTALEEKKRLVADFLGASPGTVWDLGANTGLFSRIAHGTGAFTVSWDVDPAAVEKNWHTVKEKGETNLLPLLLDLVNPTPGLGWAGRERMSFAERGPAGTVMALALVHHLAIANNLPLPMIAEYLSVLGRRLIIEFVPKDDSQVRRLLASREDIFPGYHQQGFEEAFSAHFCIRRAEKVGDSLRTLYLMEKRAS